MAEPNSRLLAAKAIKQVLSDQVSLDSALEKYLARALDKDKAFIQAMSYGVLRWHEQLNFILNQLLKKPFKQKDSDLLALALLGLYQLKFSRVKPHAAVSETVTAVKKSGRQWAASVINGVLRNYLRNRETLDAEADSTVKTRLSHPDWIVEKTAGDWPDHYLAILDANNRQGPMTLRINKQQTSITAYLTRLDEVGIDATPHSVSINAITLKKPLDLEKLPGFWQGEVSIQDAAAQLSAHLMQVGPGLRLLDSCAAPGGKSCHLLELVGQPVALTAIDCDAGRLEKVQENLDRLGLTASLVHADAEKTADWWDGIPYDRILIDAPCSGSGVIRRHPDIKLLRKPHDIDTLAGRQRDLLEKLWPLLKPGGILLYATCSIFKQENEEQITAFVDRHPDASELKIEAEWGLERPYGRQILTGSDDMDGFYYARLQKIIK